MTDIILILLLVWNFLNTIILIVIGAFLVRFRDRFNGLFIDFLKAFENLPIASISNFQNKPLETKTWDEKYEHEIEEIQKRMRIESGLLNLPDPVVSWGQPPIENLENMKDLNVKKI